MGVGAISEIVPAAAASLTKKKIILGGKKSPCGHESQETHAQKKGMSFLVGKKAPAGTMSPSTMLKKMYFF